MLNFSILLLNTVEVATGSAKQYLWLFVLIGFVSLAIGIFGGYFIGAGTLRKDLMAAIDDLARREGIKHSIVENLGQGIIAYSKSGNFVIKNDAIKKMKVFQKTRLPDTIEEFVALFDRGNRLRTKYLMALESSVQDDVHATLEDGGKYYEIRILSREISYRNGDSDARETFDIVLVEDVTKQREHENRQKDLVENVSHELKTPLAVIATASEILDCIEPGNVPTYDELVMWRDRIHNSADRMKSIVEDFLQLSNGLHGKHMHIYDANYVLEKASENLRYYRDNSDAIIRFEMNLDYGVDVLFGNEELIVTVVTNLLKNAVKYIDYEGKTSGHEIVARVLQIEDSIGIEITDNGRGVPQKDIEHLFERFYRVDNSGSRATGGSGLGLAISKEIVELNDGSILVTSKEREGSTFRVLLPKASYCFEMVYGDAYAGVLPEDIFHVTALDYLIEQMPEAADSYGCDMEVLMPLFDRWAKRDTKDIDSSYELRLEILKAFGKDNVATLVEELTIADFGEQEKKEIWWPIREVRNNSYVEQTKIEQASINQATVEQATVEQAPVEQAYVEQNDYMEEASIDVTIIEDDEDIKDVMDIIDVEEVASQDVKSGENRLFERGVEAVSDANQVENARFVSAATKNKSYIHPEVDKRLYNSTGKLFGKEKTSKKTQRGAGIKEPNENKERSEASKKFASMKVLDDLRAIDSKIAKSADKEE